MKNIALVVLPIIILLLSCKAQTDERIEIDPEAISLNNIAIRLILENPDSALLLLDQVLEIDPNYGLAYANKLMVLNGMDRPEEALKTVIAYSKIPKFPIRQYALIGMQYEAINEPDSSKKYFMKALEHFETESDWKNEYPTGQLDYAIFTTIVHGKEKGMDIYEMVVRNIRMSEADVEYATRIRNEIATYNDGGFGEIYESEKNFHICVTTDDPSETMNELLKKGINCNGYQSFSDDYYQFLVKEKFKEVTIANGYEECP